MLNELKTARHTWPVGPFVQLSISLVKHCAILPAAVILSSCPTYHTTFPQCIWTTYLACSNPGANHSNHYVQACSLFPKAQRGSIPDSGHTSCHFSQGPTSLSSENFCCMSLDLQRVPLSFHKDSWPIIWACLFFFGGGSHVAQIVLKFTMQSRMILNF